MFNIHKNKLTLALVAGAMALSTSAIAGTITETSVTPKAGFSYNDGSGQYERTMHVDEDTGYKSGSPRVIKSTLSNFHSPGAMKHELGWEKQEVTFDPSNLATASEGKDDMRPKSLPHAAPNYFLDDSDYRYHLAN